MLLAPGQQDPLTQNLLQISGHTTQLPDDDYGVQSGPLYCQKLRCILHFARNVCISAIVMFRTFLVTPILRIDSLTDLDAKQVSRAL